MNRNSSGVLVSTLHLDTEKKVVIARIVIVHSVHSDLTNTCSPLASCSI
jgi:hypothetical protein